GRRGPCPGARATARSPCTGRAPNRRRARQLLSHPVAREDRQPLAEPQLEAALGMRDPAAPVPGADAFAQERTQRIGQPGLELAGCGVALTIEVGVQPAYAGFVEIDDGVHVLLRDAS